MPEKYPCKVDQTEIPAFRISGGAAVPAVPEGDPAAMRDQLPGARKARTALPQILLPGPESRFDPLRRASGLRPPSLQSSQLVCGTYETVKRIWHRQDRQGQILALACR